MSLQVGIPLLLAAAIVQAALLPSFRVFGGQPDLVIIIVLAWSMLDPEQEGMVWAFTGGLFLDLFSGVPLGISSLALLPAAYIATVTEAQIYRNNMLLPLLLAAGGALAYHVIYLILLRFVGGLAISWADALGYVTLPSVLFDVILMVPVLRVLTRWYDRLHPRQVKL